MLTFMLVMCAVRHLSLLLGVVDSLTVFLLLLDFRCRRVVCWCWSRQLLECCLSSDDVFFSSLFQTWSVFGGDSG